MLRSCVHNLLVLLYIFILVCRDLPFSHGNLIESKVLTVGEELWKEPLPLQMGSRLYQLQGLKPHTQYEVKISYPASIPSSFSIQLKKGYSELELNRQRKLLNCEKLIFKSDDLDLLTNQGGMYVLVTVEPEGVVAIPHGQEREYVIYNIVCDELLLGIPHKAWWVVILVLLCSGLAFVIPSFLATYLLPTNRSSQPSEWDKRNYQQACFGLEQYQFGGLMLTDVLEFIAHIYTPPPILVYKRWASFSIQVKLFGLINFPFNWKWVETMDKLSPQGLGDTFREEEHLC